MKKIVCVLLGIVTTVSVFLFCGCSFLDRFSKKEEIVSVSGKAYEFYSYTAYSITNKLNKETGEVEKHKHINGTYYVGDKHLYLEGDKTFKKTSMCAYFGEDGSLLFDGEIYDVNLLYREKTTWKQKDKNIDILFGEKVWYEGYMEEDTVVIDYFDGNKGHILKMNPVEHQEEQLDIIGLYKFQSLKSTMDGETKEIAVGQADDDGYVYQAEMLYMSFMPGGALFVQSKNLESLNKKTNGTWKINDGKLSVNVKDIGTSEQIEYKKDGDTIIITVRMTMPDSEKTIESEIVMKK